MQRDAPSPRRTEVPGILPDARSRLIGAALVPTPPGNGERALPVTGGDLVRPGG
jgi:hypothetical protein